MNNINIAETKHKKFWQTCSFGGCSNRYLGIKNQKYCIDERCKEARDLYAKTKTRKRSGDADGLNITLIKTKHSRHLKNGQVLKLRCRAKNSLKVRCSNTFLITYDPKQNVYPMFCDCHRSPYKRIRFKECTYLS